MSDAKYFQRGKIHELRSELVSEKKDPKHAKKKVVMKRIVANMTMGNDMSPLFADVVACMNIPVLEIKKMIYLYLINYSRWKPEMALLAINSFVRDVSDPNPMIRGMAIRTMGYIQVDKILDCLCGPLRNCLDDRAPYVAKTAAIAVAKLYMYDRVLVENEGFLDQLRFLLNHDNSTVVANAVAALLEISDRSDKVDLVLEVDVANRLLTAMNESSEWGQAYILEALTHVLIENSNDAELLAERVLPRLSHANSAVVLGAVKAILYFTNYISKDDVVNSLYKKLGPPMVTLLHNQPEVQYVALRNMLLILQKQPEFLRNEMKAFFCKFDDPIYVKISKLEIMVRLASDKNIDLVLPEFKEYATELDVDFVRKAVRAIGRCAIQIPESTDKCVQALVELVETKVNYIVQEAIVVIKDIFRRYPNKYEGVIGTLCESLDSLDEAEAKASMIWILGHYADRIDNADELLASFLDTSKEEGGSSDVQLALLTASVKLFLKRPSAGQDLITKVLKWATEEVDNPDLRDRGFIYWRLLSTDPVAAKAIVLGDTPAISTETDNMEPALVNELLLYVNSLASIYHKPPSTFIGGVKDRRLVKTPALHVRDFVKLTDARANDALIYGNGYMNNPYATDIGILAGPEDIMAEQIGEGGAFFDGDNNEDAGAGPNGGGPGTDVLGAFDPMFNPGTPFGLNPMPFGANNQQINLDGMQIFGALPTQGNVYGNLGLLGQQQPTLPALHTSVLNPPTPVQQAHNPFAAAAGGGAPSPARLNSLNIGGLPQSVAPGTPGTPGTPTSAVAAAVSGGGPSGKPVVLDPFGMSGLSSEVGAMSISKDRPDSPTRFFGPGAQSVTTPAPPSQAIASPTKMVVGADELFSPGGAVGYVPPKTIFLASAAGQGLEISGTFARRQGQVCMEMTFTNTSLQTLADFAILFNKNTFGLSPATALQVDTPLAPMASTDISLAIRNDGAGNPTVPINNLQVALKCALGILYFQAQIPLHVLFTEAGALEPNAWLNGWQDLTGHDVVHPIANIQITSMDELRRKLQLNNVFSVAERIVEGLVFIFASVKLVDSSVYLSEMKFDPAQKTCVVTTRTLNPTAASAVQAGIELVLHS